MSFYRDVSFRSAGTDLIGFLRTPGQHSPWLFLAACVPTAIIIYTFYLDTLEKAKPPPPTVTYFESWPLTRTLAESKAAIAERQKVKDEMICARKRHIRHSVVRSGWMSTGSSVRRKLSAPRKGRRHMLGKLRGSRTARNREQRNNIC